MRVISFRHEQHAGNAASIAGYLTQKPGICLTVSAPGFLNGLTALANATTNCFPMILISGSSEREIVDLQQGDYEEMDKLAILSHCARRRFAYCTPKILALVLPALFGPLYLAVGWVILTCLQAFSQTMDAVRPDSLVKVVDAAPRLVPGSIPALDAFNQQKSHCHPWQGLRWVDQIIKDFVEKSGALPANEHGKGLLPDDHPQSAGARSLVLKKPMW